jgi:hypothetical protein
MRSDWSPPAPIWFKDRGETMNRGRLPNDRRRPSGLSIDAPPGDGTASRHAHGIAVFGGRCLLTRGAEGKE